MTRIAYFSDTHLGAGEGAYQQQTGCYGELPQVLAELRAWMQEERVDLALHGGDLIHTTSDADILAGAALMDLGVPVSLCLGNHDLTTPDAQARWLELAPQLFHGDATDYTIARPDVAIHVLTTRWELGHVHWAGAQNANFLPAQVEQLDRQLAAHADRPQIVLTHTPIFGLPPGQTGFPGPYHEPAPLAREALVAVVERHPSVRCVLGAHNHLNMCHVHAGVPYVTSSALIETPFEVKLIEIADGHVSMRTVSLVHRLPLLAPYNHDRSYVQGRPIDRQFGQQDA